MYNIDIVIKALSLYGENKSFKKQDKYYKINIKKITSQTIMNWDK